MGQFDANATKEQLAQMEREFARKRAAAALRRAKELARLSDERVSADAHGTEWTYIVVDGRFARVCGCETECETLAVPGEVEGYPVLEIDAEALSGLESLECPKTVIEIGEKAFLRCQSLREVRLNEGLRSLGDDAFAGSSLEALRIPASVARLGRSVAERTNVRHSGAGATFSIDARNTAYFIDEHGCLYAHRGDEVQLAQMLEPSVSEYSVRAETVAIEGRAFAYHEAIESVRLSEG